MFPAVQLSSPCLQWFEDCTADGVQGMEMAFKLIQGFLPIFLYLNCCMVHSNSIHHSVRNISNYFVAGILVFGMVEIRISLD